MQKKLNQILLSKKQNYKRLSLNDFKDENALLNAFAELTNSGTDVIEFYAPDYPSKTVLKTGKKLRELSAQLNTLFLIYDRIDIAKLLDADGVVLDETSMSTAQAQKLIENTMLVGLYAKTEEEAKEAEKTGADFLLTAEVYSQIEIKTFLK